MNTSSIQLSDWERILLGEAPAAFLLEVLLRSLFIYLILLIVIRIMGKRMSGQLTITEMAVMLALGAIISLPMQSPDRGVMQGALLLALFLGFQRGLTLWMVKSRKAEDLTQGKMSLLVKDGIIQVAAMQRENISHEQLFAVLRNQQVYNLGDVKRVYLESCGSFSIYREAKPHAGLAILPPGDAAIHKILPGSKDMMACHYCGNTVNGAAPPACMVCGSADWEPAVQSTDQPIDHEERRYSAV